MDAGMDAGMDAAPTPGGGSARGSGCADDEVCVRGRCYDRCSSDRDCSRAEMCDSTSGICVVRTVPLPDAMIDAPLPCDGVECDTDAGLFCHPTAAQCVSCTPGMDDGCDAVGFCDYGRGACVGPVMATCAPCDRSADCPGGQTCVDRLASDGEKVCLPPCPMEDAGLCPAGLQCNAASGNCEPPNASCTNYRLSVSGASCAEDRDCFTHTAFPAGIAPGGCLPGADGGVGRCQIPCMTTDSTEECPGGFICRASFCEMGP